MKSAQAREIIFNNMDAMALLFDARDNLILVKNGLTVYINKLDKSINKGVKENQNLESYTKQAA